MKVAVLDQIEVAAVDVNRLPDVSAAVVGEFESA
jgi:hypothetical protein|tara:strand:+ start:8756 stop:8857 length:102 start_codon:yes stop_codon:yes gene_type:complete